MTVIDAHHHLWNIDTRRHGWLDAPDLARIRRSYGLAELRRHTEAAGVEHTVLVQTLADMDETRELLVTAQGSQGLVAGVVGWVDLRDPDIAEHVEELRAGAGGEFLVGVRHLVQDEPDPGWLARPDVIRGLRVLAGAGLTYDLLVLPHQLPAAIEAVATVPDGRFVLDHGAKPPVKDRRIAPWSDDLRELARSGDVTCKVSGLVTEADWAHWSADDLRPYVEVMVEAFGAGRLMAGSDWPVCELAATYEQVWATTRELVGPLDGEGVLGDVARHFYGLHAAP